MGNSKFNVSDASRLFFPHDFLRAQNMGNDFDLAGGSRYRGSNYSKCMTEIQGKSILVRVSESSSYRESTVF